MEEKFATMKAIEFNRSYNTSVYDDIQFNSGFLVSCPVFRSIFEALFKVPGISHIAPNINHDVFIWFNHSDLQYFKYDHAYVSNFILEAGVPNSYELNDHLGYLYLGKSRFFYHIVVSSRVPPMHFSVQVAEKSKYEKLCQYESETLLGPPEPLNIEFREFVAQNPVTDFVSLYDFYLPVLLKTFLTHTSYDSIRKSLDSAIITEVHEA